MSFKRKLENRFRIIFIKDKTSEIKIFLRKGKNLNFLQYAYLALSLAKDMEEDLTVEGVRFSFISLDNESFFTHDELKPYYLEDLKDLKEGDLHFAWIINLEDKSIYKLNMDLRVQKLLDREYIPSLESLGFKVMDGN